MINERDGVDAEAVERARDEVERILRGEPRPVPRVPGVPQFMVEDVLGLVNPAFVLSDEANEDLQRGMCYLYLVKVEPILFRWLQELVAECRELGVRPGAEWKAVGPVREWVVRARDLVERFQRRAFLEAELLTRPDGLIDRLELERALWEWDPEEE